jgi:phosphate transport system substrate-binding protein
MKYKSMKAFLVAAIFTGLVLGASPAFSAEEIIISCSTTVLPVMQKAGKAFMAANPGITLAISGGDSGNGVNAPPAEAGGFE